MKQGRYSNRPPNGGGEQKKLVNVEDASYSLIMRIPTEEWDDPPYTGLVFFQTSSK